MVIRGSGDQHQENQSSDAIFACTACSVKDLYPKWPVKNVFLY
jgi:hypothetical protein